MFLYSIHSFCAKSGPGHEQDARHGHESKRSHRCQSSTRHDASRVILAEIHGCHNATRQHAWGHATRNLRSCRSPGPNPDTVVRIADRAPAQRAIRAAHHALSFVVPDLLSPRQTMRRTTALASLTAAARLLAANAVGRPSFGQRRIRYPKEMTHHGQRSRSLEVVNRQTTRCAGTIECHTHGAPTATPDATP